MTARFGCGLRACGRRSGAEQRPRVPPSLVVHFAFLLAWFSAAPVLAAEGRLHAIIVGNNGGMQLGGGSRPERLGRLAHADDDAAAFAELVGGVAVSMHVLSVLDAETQALYPDLVARSTAPTAQALQRAVRHTVERIAQEPAARHRVLFFFSGHGVLNHQGEPALLLEGSGLTRSALYEGVLRPLASHEVHVLVDACHAEAVVRPRGAGDATATDLAAALVPLSSRRRAEFLTRATLAQFPNVGALVAASASSEAHELSSLGQGVFTHQLLSGLRGGADINGDRQLEYSEMYAFLSAANRTVAARHRLRVVSHPPPAHLRRPLFSAGDIPEAKAISLVGLPPERVVVIKDGLGRSLVTLHADSSYSPELRLPAGAPLYVRVGAWEASLPPSPGSRVEFSELSSSQSAFRSRRGAAQPYGDRLFEAPFGRLYYDAVVAQGGELLPVQFGPPAVFPEAPDERSAGAGVTLVVGAGVARGLSAVAPTATGFTLGARPRAVPSFIGQLSYARAHGGGLAEHQLDANVSWQWPLSLPLSRLRTWTGPTATLGGVFQRARSRQVGETLRGGVGWTLALTARLVSGVELWGEVRGGASLYRRRSRLSNRFEPSSWLGLAFFPAPSR